MRIRRTFEYHPKIGYRYLPEFKARIPDKEFGGYLIQTNSQGFRDVRDFSVPKSPGTKRVLLFGDSYSAGYGVSNNKRFSNFLEQQIEGLEIFNFALPGTGTDQQYIAYKEYATEIEHDLLIIAPLVENIRRNVAQYRIFTDQSGNQVAYAKPYYELTDGELILKGSPPSKEPIPKSELAPEIRTGTKGRLKPLKQWIKKRGLQSIAQKISRYQPVPEYNQPNHPDWLLMEAILKQWITNHTKPVLLLAFPLREHSDGVASAAPYQARFNELALESGCQFHDPLPDLLKVPYSERQAFRFPRDCHFTPAGHQAVADSLKPTLQQLLFDQ